ncbi:tyrosine-type recombinase/integrase [Salinarimonas chemoclinalis]|uniref:tyrosine-type recombinase/integrase n=1 Tax=Salinarimonas chemoclinalis TaxID=3241599 RepID=UPI0035572CE1
MKKGTRRTYRSNAKNWLCAFPLLRLDEIDRSTLALFVSRRKDQGVSDTTIRRDIAFLGTVCSMAISWGWLEANPITALSKRFLKEAPPRTRFLTRREFERLHAAASETLKPQLVLAVETGMRKEELLSLTLDAIDLSRREIHLQETKTNSPRRVPLSDVAIATISDLIAKPGRPRSRFLFCKPDGTRILCNKKGFRAACERAAIADFRFHDLRHTFASWWVQSGGDLYKLSRVLGHRTLQMSARYGHLRTDDLHEEMRKVGKRRG